jgi:hypothetical protein
MRLRLFAVIILVLILCTILPVSPSATPTMPPFSLTILAPPADIELPEGQGVEIRCQLASSAGQRAFAGRISLEFLVDGIPLRRAEAAPGQVVTAGWIPAGQGAHTLYVVAYLDARPVGQAWQQVFVLPAGTPVHVP